MAVIGRSSLLPSPQIKTPKVSRLDLLTWVFPIFLFVQPHLAADNLDKIHDERGNNLLHIAASQGHAECLQHLTSLMGEDCLNERNAEKLTPAGLAIKVSSWGSPQLKVRFLFLKIPSELKSWDGEGEKSKQQMNILYLRY